MTDFFGVPDSDGSWYATLAATHDFGNGFGLNASVGYQGLKGGAAVTEIGGNVADSITDYKIGGTYTIDGWVLGLAYVATNRDLPGTTRSDQPTGISATALQDVSKFEHQAGWPAPAGSASASLCLRATATSRSHEHEDGDRHRQALQA